MADVTVSEAGQDDVASLTTIVSRAFHPVNPFFLRLFPDTSSMRDWWHKIFTSARTNPACHLLTAIDNNNNTATSASAACAPDSPDQRAIGVLLLHRCGGPNVPDEGAEFWTAHDLTPDHDAELFASTVAPISGPRARIMQGREHYLVQLLGVDHARQGGGVGKMLLDRACEVADGDGLDMFVEANMRAAPFYMRFGFELQEEVAVSGGVGYVEGLLVRPARSA